ncbi:hypothetical protein DPX16_7328 [Anabarilius grahami]|uniref:Uncharacterized protein n=1 Tax=Anabarilius grahami TaxID=495550 RepID=A0A3N0Z2S1_ANAGA|nr:hypothetical protein DPX16_7328 [Anabarilius grahami]
MRKNNPLQFKGTPPKTRAGVLEHEIKVWSIQSSEAELWVVWTDIDCNDGLLLMDRIKVWSVQSSEAELWVVWTDIDCNDGLLLMDRSITAAGHGAGAQGGTRLIPTPSFTHIAEIRLGSNQQPLNP